MGEERQAHRALAPAEVPPFPAALAVELLTFALEELPSRIGSLWLPVVVAVLLLRKVLACKVREDQAVTVVALRVSVVRKVQAAARAVEVVSAPQQAMAAMVVQAIRIAVPRVSQASQAPWAWVATAVTA